MEVLMMIGPYAGAIRDIKPFYARQMIDDGRALDPNAPLQERVAEVVAAPVLPEVPALQTTGKRKRGSD